MGHVGPQGQQSSLHVEVEAGHVAPVALYTCRGGQFPPLPTSVCRVSWQWGAGCRAEVRNHGIVRLKGRVPLAQKCIVSREHSNVSLFHYSGVGAYSW